MKKGEITVLVVEDDSTTRLALVEAIRKFGYKVAMASKPDEALSLIKLRPVHAAVVDVLLPKINGVELVKEIRQTPFGKSPVIFVSGIFRAKAQIEDSVRKAEAVDFLIKPVDLKVLRQVLDTALAPLTESVQIELPALLSTAFTSSRERIKALETIGDISGFDVPYLLSLLMADSLSGYLNISDSNGEIFGITIVRGAIAKLDSSESHSTLTELVIQKGFITREEVNAIPKEKLRGDIIRYLISESLASPHMLYPIVHDQILAGIKKLVEDRKFKFTFSKGEINDVGNFLILEKCIPLFNEVCEKIISPAYLENFYQGWLARPIRRTPRFQITSPLFQSSVVQSSQALIEKINLERPLDEILKSSPDRTKALRAIHFMALGQMINFDDVERTNAKLEHFQKLQDTLKRIENKNPVEIFVYFGAGPQVKPAEIERIYKEFAKANHPDLVPMSALPELKQTVHKVFSMVSGAHDTLVNEEKRKQFFNEIKNTEFQKQVKAESLAEQGVRLMQNGKVRDALNLFTEAIELHKSVNTVCYYAWAKLKSYPTVVPPKVIREIAASLDAVSPQERRIAPYQFAVGLLKKVQGDLDGAVAFFDRATLMDQNFAFAEKEVAAIKDQERKSFDLLNGDITTIVANLFKKK